MKITSVEALKVIATNVRKGIIEEVYSAKSGHPGGALSIADILTVLYFNQMNIDEKSLMTQIEIGLYYQKVTHQLRYIVF